MRDTSFVLLKALKRTNSPQVCSVIRPAPVSPAPACNRGPADKGRVEPEAVSVLQPYKGITE